MTPDHLVAAALAWIGALSVLVAAPASLVLVTRLGKAFGTFQGSMQEAMQDVKARQDRHGDALHEVKQDIKDINLALPTTSPADTPLTALMAAPSGSVVTDALERILPLVTGHATQASATVADAIHKAQEISNTQEIDRSKAADKTLQMNRADLAPPALPADGGGVSVAAVAPATAPVPNKLDADTPSDTPATDPSTQADTHPANPVTAFISSMLGGGKTENAEAPVGAVAPSADVTGSTLAPPNV